MSGFKLIFALWYVSNMVQMFGCLYVDQKKIISMLN